ncbi:VirB4-like conjugal transfer ATPase, CD1110 family [Paenibacillus odorifer]|uniref:Conjugal transfer protein n=1 Tax=Paenibacillus odorifer TaxID=189426 RepID=A0A1R0XL19_9BACL|nr:ATP-binding protein [Paenibacillus odorifer]OMD35657.1 conjugal transfer protein [Paenibacillus odorifer]
MLFPSQKKAKRKVRVPKNVQQSIPYSLVSDDGILQHGKVRFSKTFALIDINYQVGKQDDQEEVFAKYCEFLNFFDESVNVQVNILNKSFNKDEFARRVIVEQKNDFMTPFREEYNKMIKSKISGGKNEVKKVKYITISIESISIDEARSAFSRIERETQAIFKRMGSSLHGLDLSERLEMLHDIYRMGQEGQFVYEPSEHKKKGLLTKDLIAADSMTFKRDHMIIGDRYARALYIKDLPTFLNDKFLSEITDFSFNLLLTMNIKSVNSYKALRIVKRQITGMEANKIEYQKRSLKNGYLEPFIPHELKHSLTEANELLDDLINKNQKMFLTNIVIIHFAEDMEHLNKDSKEIAAIASKFLCQTGTLHYQQEDALNSCLPYGLNLLKISRTLTTESTAIFMPFTNQELFQENGMYYGLNAVSRKLIMFNRLSLDTPNGFILGTPGSGKSFSAKREMVNVLLNTEDDVIIIDPEREYTRLVNNFHGEVIHISAGSKNYINPLDMTMDYADDDDPLMLKSDFVLSLCEVIVGGRYGLSPKEKSIIDRCLKLTYHTYLQTFDPKDIPTLIDFYEQLQKQEDLEAIEIATALELYVKGNLSVFANKTNININNRLVCYDIKDLGKQLKTMGMLIVLDQVWNRITENRGKGKRTWIYIDEIYLLFTNEYSASFLYELYKRARKWGGIPTGITQNVEDLLKSDLARTMLSNSSFLMMLNQAKSDRKELAALLDISETQLSYVTNADRGQGLMFIGNGEGKGIIPFVDEFPRETKLYKMMTTKVDEVRAAEIADRRAAKENTA